MSLQQVVQPRPSANGFGHQRVEREMGSRLDSKPQAGMSNLNSFNIAGTLYGSKVGVYGSPSHDRLTYLTTCLIGHHVEVQLKNGSIFSGIFHATNAEKDFGVILKMARLIKDGSFGGQKSLSDSIGKPPSKTLIIPAKELVQIIAKGVPLSGDGLANDELQCEKQPDIMIDSLISQSHSVEVGRELERWNPDEDDLQLPELENIFDDPWNRNWDQFETNEALFGVRSTFDEELYTTKLERGPQMRELEREASRIAREIEGEETQDLHLAEERGFCFHEDFDVDEETRFSSVFRGDNGSGYEENEDTTSDSQNTEMFGGSSSTVISRSFSDVTRGRSNDGAQASSSSLSMDEAQSSQSIARKDLHRSSSSDHTKQLTSDCVSNTLSNLDGWSRMHKNQFREWHGGKSYSESTERKTCHVGEEAQTSKSEDIQSSQHVKKAVSDKGGLSPSASAFAPSSSVSPKVQENSSLVGSSYSSGSGKESGTKQAVNARGRPGSSTSSTAVCVAAPSASSGPGLSPGSSVGSLSLEKSSLNPDAKEFKLNPNAKSFIPSQTPLRPPSPVSEGSFYLPANVSGVPHVHTVPVGIGIAPPFGHQPVIYNPQATLVQSPQPHVHPNGRMYGQQMILGHPRQVLYMPSYPPETPYKGREF